MNRLASILFLSSLAITENSDAIVAANGKLPTHIFSCSKSVISEMGGRLRGDTDFSSGVYVSFQNQGHQVDYGKVGAIIKSKIGDPVFICLVSIPKNCPPGDTRGKFYTVTNLRTLESWTLPDSQHQCGGA